MQQAVCCGWSASSEFCSAKTSPPSCHKTATSRNKQWRPLREVYDGSWDRPIGGDGGRVLSWAGKCGVVGGVTPSFDRYSVIVNTLGDRFMLLRLPDVDAEKQAISALDRRDQDTQMRSELAAAMTGLIHAADLKLSAASWARTRRRGSSNWPPTRRVPEQLSNATATQENF
jgi:hypothetical protein